MLMAVAIEISPPSRKEIIAPEPASAKAIPGRTNIPAPIIVPVPIAKVEKKPRLHPNLSVVSTDAIFFSVYYRVFKPVNPSLFKSSNYLYFDNTGRRFHHHTSRQAAGFPIPVALDLPFE
jgi:hypothetical protein